MVSCDYMECCRRCEETVHEVVSFILNETVSTELLEKIKTVTAPILSIKSCRRAEKIIRNSPFVCIVEDNWIQSAVNHHRNTNCVFLRRNVERMRVFLGHANTLHMLGEKQAEVLLAAGDEGEEVEVLCIAKTAYQAIVQHIATSAALQSKRQPHSRKGCCILL